MSGDNVAIITAAVSFVGGGVLGVNAKGRACKAHQVAEP
jgi:hypothetical protein